MLAEVEVQSPAVVEYRDVEGWPGYRVSSDGCVWSCKDFQGRQTDSWRRLKTCTTDRGYLTVSLCKNNTKKTKRVHQLVILAFKGQKPNGCVVCHNDGNPSNNASTNLRWGTSASNAADKVLHGTHVRGQRSPNAKITNAQAIEIKRRLATKTETGVALAKEFGVTPHLICRINTGKTWSHIVEEAAPV